MKKLFSFTFIFYIFLIQKAIFSQNQLNIPPTISGTNIQLNVQQGTTNIYSTNPTPTYGINGVFLSPTIVVNKGDVVTLNVNNQLNVSTTMHWHGLHVSPENDGGPHQSILAGSTWSPTFEILNNAGTFWYHPHGHGKTELHVGKGLAGLFIIHDEDELALNLPQNYGVDDIPIIVQTKAFDVFNQVAIANHMDTAVFVNGTLNAFVDLPAQVVRLRLLNGSSIRTYNFGFTNGITFHQIASDGGLLPASIEMNRLLLAPGERAEVLVDLSSLIGQNFSLFSYASEMTNGIFGSPSVGIGNDTIHDYMDNLLNGNDFKLLSINVVSPTLNPINLIPSSLVPFSPININTVDVNRTLIFDTLTILPGITPSLTEGPFGINRKTFFMDSINEIVPLNSTEIWTLINKTQIAHPFHIHDIQFNIIERNGNSPALNEQAWKDVVLVLPNDTVKFITKFTTFSDSDTPYMYHCHLLHHEDDGMMGSFLVTDPNAKTDENELFNFELFPNPSHNIITIKSKSKQAIQNIIIYSIDGKECISLKTNTNNINIDLKDLTSGIYFVNLDGGKQNIRFEKQ